MSGDNLITITGIRDRIGCERYQVKYWIRTRQVAPLRYVGNTALYSKTIINPIRKFVRANRYRSQK